MARKIVLRPISSLLGKDGHHRGESPRTAEHHKKLHLTRVAMVGAVAFSMSATALIGASRASAAVPIFPDNLNVFPDRDFISVAGYLDHVGQTATVNLTRAGVIVGSAQGVVEPPAKGDLPGANVAFEINHPGGVCWGNGTGLNVTPDIQPGDVASISFAGIPDGDTTVQDGSVTASSVQVGTTVTVTGHVGPGVIQANTEQRLVDHVGLNPFGGHVSAVLGPLLPDPKGGYSSGMTFNSNNTFTATYVFDTLEMATIAGDAQFERLMAWETTDPAGNRQGMTISEFGETNGPTAGFTPACPAAAPDAVTVAPAVVNQASVAAGGNVTVSGASFNSSEVSLTVKGPDGVATAATATAIPAPAATSALPGAVQSWTTTIPISAIAAIPDGLLELAMTTKRVAATGVGTIPGRSAFLTKDTVAPAAPALSLGTGTYIGTQLVTVTGPADTSVLRYQIGGPGIADPTLTTGNTVTGQIGVSSSQTLKVVAFDAAGNASPVQAAAYTITAPVVPPVVPVPPVVKPATRASAPRILTAKSGKAGGKVTATASWRAPRTNGGSRVTSYRVVAQRISATGKVLKTTTSGTIKPAARSAALRLRAGTYRFRVVAVNAVGKSAMSAGSNAVRAR
jgi:hypothetical protein